MIQRKILNGRDLKFKILKMLNFIPDDLMLKIQYRISMGKKLNLKSPKRYNEKIQWYKLNYRNDLLHQCVDKYAVREYVSSKGLESILTEVYGVYNNSKEININELPNQFVLKTTNGSGGQNVIFCKDKDKFDLEQNMDLINKWFNQKVSSAIYLKEYAYYGLQSRIIAEELLISKDDDSKDLKDYKFLCFDGKVKYIWVDSNRFENHTRNFYDSKWNYIDVSCDYPNSGNNIPKPKKLSQMLKVAEILSEDFPHVRIDLYDVDDKIYFGEMTFYPSSGYRKFKPDAFDYILGENFELT